MPEYKAANAAPQAGSTKTLTINKQIRPPLLVQRCNGTTAGLGYLEVLELSMQILLLGHCQLQMGEKDTMPLLT